MDMKGTELDSIDQQVAMLVYSGTGFACNRKYAEYPPETA